MFTIVRPIRTQSTHLHLVSFCEAKDVPDNTPLLFAYDDPTLGNIMTTNHRFHEWAGLYYQIFASTDPTLGVPPMSNSFLKKYEQDNRDMEEVLLYWEQKDGQWTPFVHPRKGHVIINSLEKAPQVGQMVYFSEKTYDGFFPIIEIRESKDPITLPQHKYGVKFDNPSNFLVYHTLLQNSKSFHP